MQRVLIADADCTSADLLAQALSTEGYPIKRVTQGREVLKRIAARAVDILITEVHLPDLAAWDLIPQVRQLAPAVPIIAVTADESWETSRRVRIESGPVFFYGLKPLDLREMREVVRCAAAQRQRRHGRSGSGARTGETGAGEPDE